MSDVEVYREPGGGCYLPGKGRPCFHVFAGGAWHELYDFDGVRPVAVIPYGPHANREALGEKLEPYELPARIVATIETLSGPSAG